MTGANAGTLAQTHAGAIAALERLVRDGPIGVAVSGGGDSLALLVLVRDWAPSRAIFAATVDHGLRAESGAEAQSVAALCASLGIGHTTLQANLNPETGNLAATGREARYRMLGDWAREHGCSAVLLGHTRDDLAETLLMRLARGSGIEGLAAMDEARRFQRMTWIRPLLGLSREALRDVLKARSIPWTEDPTNDDASYDRVKARKALAALAPLGLDAAALATSAHHLARQRRVLERAMDRLADRARHWGDLGEAWLERDLLTSDERDTALRLLADTLQRISGAPYRPRFQSLSDALDAILAASAGISLSGCLIRQDNGRCLICREPRACEDMTALGEGVTVWDHRWQVTVPPGARPCRVGPLGENGLLALASAQNWTAPASWQAAPRIVRQTTPAIWSDENLLAAAPLAGFPVESTPDCSFGVENIAIGELP